MTQPISFSQQGRSLEQLDGEKLKAILIKNWPLIVLIIVVSNLTSYLTLRWTKDTFRSDSEIKLEIKSNTTALGIKTITQDENLNILSGEIEQIRSQVFLGHVLDSLDISVSYYSVGQVLDNEMYRRSPYTVEVTGPSTGIEDLRIAFRFIGEGFEVTVGKNGNPLTGSFGNPLEINGALLTIKPNPNGSKNKENDYYFVINSRTTLMNFISSNLIVEPINFNANTLRISFKDFNAFKAKVIVNAIDSLYLTYSNQQKNLANTQKIVWLNQELQGMEAKMGSYESFFKDFTITNRSSNLTEDLKSIITKINKVDSQRYDLSKKLTELNLLIDDVTENSFKTVSANLHFLPDYISRKLESLQIKKQEQDRLSLAYNENTFAFRQKERELSTLKAQVFEDLQKLKKVWLNRSVEVEAQKRQLETHFASMPDKNTEFTKNQRYYKLYEEFYLSLMKSKADFELAQAGSTPDFRILSPANFPTVPISPKRPMILVVGFVAGLVIAFILIGLSYLLNNKITSVKEIENGINLPVLGMLPANSLASKTPFYVMGYPRSRLSEAIRNLRSNMDFLSDSHSRKVVAVSSTISGEGKSFLAQNLGAVIALSKKKVILVDLDLRKPKRGLPFPVPDASKGVSTVLIKKDNWRDCVASTQIDGFHYLPNGPLPPNPSELLMNGELESLLTELKGEYDFIVLDTPPAGLVTDGVMAMKKADLSIYLFRCNYSRKENLRVLDRLVQINKIRNIAIVFNDFIPPTDNGYGYYVDEPKSSRFLKLIKR
jgi:tyrosine-protein kinase Etk/Wzc